jgi:hypothetical protein
MRKLLFALLFCFLPSIARAEPTEAAPLLAVPSGPDVITSVKKGESAPHDGQLFDQATAIRWANFLQQARVRLQLDPLFQHKVDQVEIDALKKVIVLEQDKYKKATDQLETDLTQARKEAADPPFYKTASFGFGAGVLATVVVVVGAAVLVNSAK